MSPQARRIIIRAREKHALREAGFEPIEAGLLCEKDGTYYGWEAALQKAESVVRQRYGHGVYDHHLPTAVEEGEAD